MNIKPLRQSQIPRSGMMGDFMRSAPPLGYDSVQLSAVHRTNSRFDESCVGEWLGQSLQQH